MSDPPSPDEPKQRFLIARALVLVREAIQGKPRAALFELAKEGHDSVFELLVACLISIRTRDEVTLPVSQALFADVRTPEQILELDVEELADRIAPCRYAGNKAAQIHDIARAAVEQHGGILPCDRDVLLGLRGVGPKCANLVLGIACGSPLIAVDSHVHQVVNRWGYVKTKTPEQTLAALEDKLPAKHWVEINELLVPFGKHICQPISPLCSTCPVRTMCRQVGVTRRR
jgi:endonuclease-3